MAEQKFILSNAITAGYVQTKIVVNAFKTFKQMQLIIVQSNSKSFSILPICVNIGDMEQDTNNYKSIMEGLFMSFIVVVNALVVMYAKCEGMYKAFEIFNKMVERNFLSWIAGIQGYMHNGYFEK